MILYKLADWPELRIVKRLLLFGIMLFIIVFPIMSLFFIISGYPASFLESQLSFSGQILKSHYQVTNIELYRVAQILDYGFMISYGTLIFSLTLIICRNFDTKSPWNKVGCIFAFLGVLAALCDACENAFILAMLIDPINFPDILAIIHSIFALIKWILLLTCIIWIIISFIFLKIKK